MKFLRLLLVLALPVLLFSCGEDQEPTPDNYLVVEKDGTKWESEFAPTIDLREDMFGEVDSLFIMGRRQNEIVRLQIDFKGVGTYSLPNQGAAMFYNLVGGDVVVDSYSLDPTDSNAEISITEWNPETKAIKGTFRFMGNKVPWSSTPEAKETLHFTNGEFSGTAASIPSED